MSRGLLRHAVTVALAVGVAGGFFVFWLAQSGGLPSPGGGYRVKVMAPTAAGLGPGTSVRMAGIEIGRVRSVDRRPTGALLDLEIDDEHSPLPRDSRVAVRLRTLVGENYVSIERGRSRETLPDGALVRVHPADEYVEVDQILSVLRGRTRERARRMVQGLAHALEDRGDELNEILDDGGRFIRAASPVVDTLYRDRRNLARLIDNLGYLMRVVGGRGDSLRALARDARVTFRAVARRDDSVRAMLDALPPAMRQIRATSGTLLTVTGQAAPTIAHLAETLRRLGPSLELLPTAALTGRRLVRELGAAAPPLAGTVEELRRLSAPARRALPEVRDVLCQLNPAVRFLRPYARDIATVLQNLGSTTNWYDANGHAARLFATVGPNDLAAYTPETAKALDQLMGSAVIGPFDAHTRGYNPRPEPGTVGELRQGRGASGPDDVTESYPRVRADC